MLNPRYDRLDYGSILSPPPNYKLDFAIGTTYSLDLDSLVGASIALGLSEETDTILRDDPIFLLSALRHVGDKIALFCENGRILPSNPNKLYILLEQMVFQVSTPKKEYIARYPSFHPKFWLIRFVNEEKEAIYRIIVLSRNLTFDRSWDITLSMDGKEVKDSSNQINDKNKNLTIFLNYLKEFCTDSNKTDKIEKIIKDLDYVEFDLNNDMFVDFDFIPNGVIDDVSIEEYPLCADEFDDLVIISPFLSKDVIKKFNKRAKEYKSYQKYDNSPKITRLYLFTRLESLCKLKYEDCDEFKIYILKNEIVDGEFTISDEYDSNKKLVVESKQSDEHNHEKDVDESYFEEIISNENEQFQDQHQHIHAKIYFIRKGSQVELYLGSLNASRNAFKGNVEFMIRLKTNEDKFNFNKLLNDLFCGQEDKDENPFRRVCINEINCEEPEDTVKNCLDSILKDIAHLDFKSKITFDNGLYKINLNVDDFSIFEKKEYNCDFSVSIKPLYVEKFEKLSKNMSFENLEKSDLSTFFEITIKNDDFSPIRKFIKIETEGMPDDREKDVLSSKIKNVNQFMRYVAFLLGDNPTESARESGILDKCITQGSANSIQIQFPELYEKMLNAAVNGKEKFKEIDYLIQTLSDNVIPKGFEELYNTFKEVLDDEQYL